MVCRLQISVKFPAVRVWVRASGLLGFQLTLMREVRNEVSKALRSGCRRLLTAFDEVSSNFEKIRVYLRKRLFSVSPSTPQRYSNPPDYCYIEPCPAPRLFPPPVYSVFESTKKTVICPSRKSTLGPQTIMANNGSVKKCCHTGSLASML